LGFSAIVPGASTSIVNGRVWRPNDLTIQHRRTAGESSAMSLDSDT
jgi:hypothetical protein